MTNDEFEGFLASANEELRQKQDLLMQRDGLGSYPRWWFDQATAKLQFFDEADNLALEADIIDIGSYSAKTKTWKWAWSNRSVLPALREKAEKLKELERITGIALFAHDQAFAVEGESMAWELAAIAVKHLGAMGCYRAPSSSSGPTSFLAITRILKVAGRDRPQQSG
jgi:hypothetical protein